MSRPVVAVTATALALAAAPALAIVTTTWTVETFTQFDQGDATSAFITSLGEVKPGWETQRVALEGDGVWAALRLADGSVLAGGDTKGAIWQIRGDNAKKLTSIPGAIAVVALAQGSDGAVYAGAMPGNKLWRIDVATGKATAHATLADVETIWSVAAASDGTVYAGTGPDGKLFAIDRKGNAKQAFDTEDKRVTSLLVARDGGVWLGTSERAIVFRYDPKRGNARAVADFAGNEITALAELRAGIAVAAADITETQPAGAKSAASIAAAEKPSEPKGQAAKTPEAGSKPGADKDTPSAADVGRKNARKGKGALFFVQSDGRMRQLHALTQTYITSLAVGDRDQVFAGAADKGRVYLIDADDSVATAIDVDERAVGNVGWDGKNLFLTTDDAAAFYRVTNRASAAKYVSEVLDTKTPSRFGRITWQGSGKVTLETRSGNTAKPGVGWSEWAPPSDIGPAGGGATGGRSASPAGRYLQFRATLDSDDAGLRRVSTFYVPSNEATTVEDVSVEAASKESLPTLKDSAAKPRSPVVKLKWKVENPDSDETAYTLEVRRDGEANWRPIVTGKTPLTSTSWEWNTETFPDGWYRLRVTSSDASSNSPDRAQSSSRTTPLFALDNTRPTIDALSVSSGKATARASDLMSPIAEMSFSIDDGPWQLGSCDDGIFDDLAESLRIDLPKGLTAGIHTLAIRVADTAGNIASASTTFTRK